MTRVIGLGQGRNLDILAHLALPLLEAGEWKRMGVFAADVATARASEPYRRLRREHDVGVMAEWEVVEAGLRREPDVHLLERTEREIGPPSLWAGLLADRRLFFGAAAKYRQDYAPRFDERAQLGVLTETIEAAERLWSETDPELLVGFVPVTLGEYVLLRLAAARGVPYLLLRSTKIADYVTFHDRLFGMSRHIQRHYAGSSPLPGEAVAVAREWLRATRDRGATYEGMHEPAHAARPLLPARALRALLGNLPAELRRRRDPELAHDLQDPGRLSLAWAMQVAQPLRAARVRRLISQSGRALTAADLQPGVGAPFAFFPLHFEPEVALQLYARPWQNQIEVARLIALSLPAGMHLVVKDHPRSAGLRGAGYYRKLLEIPNVLLAAPVLPSQAIVSRADIVAVITGNIALEAAALRTPVVALGQTTVSELPRQMVRAVADPYDLSGEIVDLLRGGYAHNEAALERYLAAHVASGVRADLYSTLLAKGGRLSFGTTGAQEQLDVLREHLRRRTADVLGASP